MDFAYKVRVLNHNGSVSLLTIWADTFDKMLAHCARFHYGIVEVIGVQLHYTQPWMTPERYFMCREYHAIINSRRA